MKVDKIFLFWGLVLFFTIITWISSCTHKADLENIPEICFEKDILPIFLNSCAISGCHDGTGESDLRLTGYVPISHAVEPGEPYASEIYKSIIATTGENVMPPGQPLSLEKRIMIRVWIEQGARLTTCPDTSGRGITLANYTNVAAAAANGYLNN